MYLCDVIDVSVIYFVILLHYKTKKKFVLTLVLTNFTSIVVFTQFLCVYNGGEERAKTRGVSLIFLFSISNSALNCSLFYTFQI